MAFKDKVVVITGGTGALGRAVCSVFLAQGAHVHVSYINDNELAALPAELVENELFELRRLDLTHESEVEQWFESISRLDVLVNVAGGFAMSKLAETNTKDWDFMLDMNLKTAFFTCREALKKMEANGTGRIINVGAFAATKRIAGMGPYTISKSAVMHMTEVMAEETLASKITVNAVLPTIMDTPGNRAAMPEADFSSWVPVENVANTILFLAQDESWHITGALIPVRAHC